MPQDFDLAEVLPVEQPTPTELDAMQNTELFEGDIIGVPVDEDPTNYIEKKMRDQPLNDDIDFDEIFKRPVRIIFSYFKKLFFCFEHSLKCFPFLVSQLVESGHISRQALDQWSSTIHA